MNRHSLLFQVSLFFMLLLLVINTLFVLQYELELKQADERLLKRFHEAERFLHRPGHPPPHEREDQLYSLLNMEFVDEDEIESIELKKILLEEKSLSIYEDEKYLYYVHEERRHGHKKALRFENKQSERKEISSLLLALLVNVLLFSFYFYIIKKLQPLQRLKQKIVRFSEGGLEVSLPQKGQDEISEVSNEFNNAISKIQSLQESRNLFLRNIMHELKTPISKGKLITDLMDDTKNQERLQRIFSRFEYLLGEFTKIEQVTSNALVVNKNRFRVVDILDNSFDILLIESSDVRLEINANLEIDVDYELMSIAFKNLIDNALKYGVDSVKIRIEKDAIVFESKGEALENSSFEMAFNRAFEDSSKGLGLGLYITHHIVKRHGFELKYEYHKGLNSFKVDCKN
ncbi:MAG: two-component sensor histidine kinase [uncultured Sulfurovum sp.]|uniref:histidine kinase n=1 Tax=uncultured Sulfurovum sp. TaxID=269237 RepID=A0A6S6SN44_9BACT|nr:MAG: two-component sensor histidine kinase [uncultured Sulfurovum sp.]